MWPFHLMHTVLSGFVLWQGSRQYNGIFELIDRASHWEIAGGAMLATAFLFGWWQLGCHVRRKFKRKRRANPRVKRLKIDRLRQLENPKHADKITQMARLQKSDLRDNSPRSQQTQGNLHSGQFGSNVTQGPNIQFG